MRKTIIMVAVVMPLMANAQEQRTPEGPAILSLPTPSEIFNQKSEPFLTVIQEAKTAELCGFRSDEWFQKVAVDMQGKAFALAIKMFGKDTGAASAADIHLGVWNSMVPAYLVNALASPPAYCEIIQTDRTLGHLDAFAADSGYAN